MEIINSVVDVIILCVVRYINCYERVISICD